MIKFSPVHVVLRNGAPVTIRLAEQNDAERFTSLIRNYVADSEYMVLAPGEFNPGSKEQQAWIYSMRKFENSLLLVAETDGELIGNIDITGSQRMRLQHTAILGMGLLREWRNLGLGTLMLQHAVDWARKNTMLEILWLQVFAENKAGISLYKKAGFTEHGIQPHFIKIAGHGYADNMIMGLSVK